MTGKLKNPLILGVTFFVLFTSLSQGLVFAEERGEAENSGTLEATEGSSRGQELDTASRGVDETGTTENSRENIDEKSEEESSPNSAESEKTTEDPAEDPTSGQGSASSTSSDLGIPEMGPNPFKQVIETRLNVTADEQTGALNFSYPLIIPPGRNGLQPDLALTYNNQNTETHSIFGYGWDVNIPYIKRIPRRGVDQLYVTKWNSSINNYNPIPFYSSLSGEITKLDLSQPQLPSGPLFDEHGEYGNKIEFGNFISYELTEDDKWMVEDKNGTTYIFGSTDQGRLDDPNDSGKIYQWMLEEIRDTNDNFIRYEYDNFEGTRPAYEEMDGKYESPMYPSKVTSPDYTGPCN